LLSCVPQYLDLELVLCGDTHPKALKNDCPLCWALDQPGMCRETCKKHWKTTKTIGEQLIDIAANPEHNPNITINLEIDINDSNSNDNNDNNDSHDKLTCNICMVNPKDCSLIPCGHCYCLTCVGKLNKCPECRQDFSQILKIYV
jgi:hypothetical protein